MKDLLHRIENLESKVILLIEKLEGLNKTNEILSRENIRLNQQLINLKENRDTTVPIEKEEGNVVQESGKNAKLKLIKSELDKTIEELDFCLEQMDNK